MLTSSAQLTSSPRRALAVLLLCVICSAVASAQTTNTDGHTPPGLAPGSPSGSYRLGGFESVNLFNGGLNFSLPLLQAGGRGSAGYTVPLRLEQKWRVMLFAETPENSSPVYTPVGSWWGGLTPGYGPGVMEGRRAGSGRPAQELFCGTPSEGFFERTLTRLTFTAPDGTEYELHDKLTGGTPALASDVPCNVAGKDRGTVFVTADNRSATFVSDAPVSDRKYNPLGSYDQFYPSGYLLLGDGTRYRVTNGLVLWMRDRNGNKLTFAYDGFARVSSVTDSLGRQVTFTYAGANGNGTSYDLIRFKGVNQQPRSVKVWRASLSALLRDTQAYDSAVTKTYSALFPWLTGASTQTHFNPGRASAVELPDGRRYEFRYNEYGELARVELPTRGAFEYDWVDCSGGGEGLIYRRVSERRVYADGETLESRTTYSTEPSEEVEVKTYDAAGTLLTLSKHFFHFTGYDSLAAGGDPVSYPGGLTGRERRTEAFDVAAGAGMLKQVVERMWARPDGSAECGLLPPPQSLFCPAQREPVVVTTLTTLADTNQVSKQTSINPQTGAYAFDQYGNQTDLWEYDFGAAGSGQPGALVRRTHTDYLTTNPVGGADYASASPAAASPHLRSLLTRQSVYDAAGVEQSRTTFEYDNYAPDTNHAAPLARANITGLCTTFDAAGVCANANPPAYLTRGNVTGTTSYLLTGGTVTGSVSAYRQYDVAGNVVKSIDARGKVSQVGYADSYSDGMARHTYAFPASATSPVPDPSGVYGSTTALLSSSVYDFATGQLTSTTDANGKTTTLSYTDALGAVDKLDRLRKVVCPGGAAAGGGGQTTYEYGDSAGNLFVRSRTALDRLLPVLRRAGPTLPLDAVREPGCGRAVGHDRHGV
jgi:YD repeat-containing protein